MEQDYVLIRIGQHDTGLMGFHSVLALTAEKFSAESDDAEVAEFMLMHLKEKNYIPDGAKENYATAFVREFKKYIGADVSDHNDVDDIPEVLIVGAGCSQCDGLEQTVMGVLAELGLPARLDHIRDLSQIARMGIMGKPALVINNDVKCAGRVPSRGQIRRWLVMYAKKTV